MQPIITLTAAATATKIGTVNHGSLPRKRNAGIAREAKRKETLIDRFLLRISGQAPQAGHRRQRGDERGEPEPVDHQRVHQADRQAHEQRQRDRRGDQGRGRGPAAPDAAPRAAIR